MRTHTILVAASAAVLLLAATGAAEARLSRRTPSAVRFERRGPVKALPSGHVTLRVGSFNCYYHAGVFYRKGAAGYAVIGAPLGARVRALPAGYRVVHLGTVPYYYYYGTYYVYEPAFREYVVVEAPTEAPALNSSGLDVVRLTDGNALEGRFVGGGGDEIVIEVNGDMRVVPLADVVAIEMAPPPGN